MFRMGGARIPGVDGRLVPLLLSIPSPCTKRVASNVQRKQNSLRMERPLQSGRRVSRPSTNTFPTCEENMVDDHGCANFASRASARRSIPSTMTSSAETRCSARSKASSHRWHFSLVASTSSTYEDTRKTASRTRSRRSAASWFMATVRCASSVSASRLATWTSAREARRVSSSTSSTSFGIHPCSSPCKNFFAISKKALVPSASSFVACSKRVRSSTRICSAASGNSSFLASSTSISGRTCHARSALPSVQIAARVVAEVARSTAPRGRTTTCDVHAAKSPVSAAFQCLHIVLLCMVAVRRMRST
mmetsp:Transcript_11545/g.70965  ORF Transcript_11545/g.70965 Transcript_11545/m.70965 type:complete len:306 (-) Transcript_11545:427-1344(-)